MWKEGGGWRARVSYVNSELERDKIDFFSESTWTATGSTMPTPPEHVVSLCWLITAKVSPSLLLLPPASSTLSLSFLPFLLLSFLSSFTFLLLLSSLHPLFLSPSSSLPSPDVPSRQQHTMSFLLAEWLG
jgi:hypothetical protein